MTKTFISICVYSITLTYLTASMIVGPKYDFYDAALLVVTDNTIVMVSELVTLKSFIRVYSAVKVFSTA